MAFRPLFFSLDLSFIYLILIFIKHYYFRFRWRKDLNIMKEIFQEYGGILITVVAILSIILVVTAVIGSDATGIVGKTFSDLITNFSNHANMSVK